MNKINYFFRKLMYGRYGSDELNMVLLGLYFALTIINIFFKNDIVSYLGIVITILVLIRMFSKNITARSIENNKYLRVKARINNYFKGIKRNWRDRHTFIYKKCPKCKTTLKLQLPSKRGTKGIVCPKCKHSFNVFCLRKQKVEVIRPK